MWDLWRGTKYTIRGKVVASPKSGPWWVLWVWVCPWFILVPKVFQLCTNQLVIWFCVGPCQLLKCLSIFLVPSWSSNMPFYPWNVVNQGMCPNFLFFHCFHLRFTFEYLEEVGSASRGIRALVELDSLFGKFWWHQKGTVNQYRRPWWKNPPRTYKFHPRLLGRRNKRTKRTTMIMKMKSSNQPQSFSL